MQERKSGSRTLQLKLVGCFFAVLVSWRLDRVLGEVQAIMSLRVISVLLLLLLAGFAYGCQRRTTTSATTPSPSTTPADVPLTSPAGVTAALERRWPLQNIARYCSHERRFWHGCQNLVRIPHCEQNGEVWEADLFKGTETGFDHVWWYATVCDRKIQAYSVNANRGSDHWVIEIGVLDSLETPPEIEPSPKNQCFQDEHDARSKERDARSK